MAFTNGTVETIDKLDSANQKIKSILSTLDTIITGLEISPVLAKNTINFRNKYGNITKPLKQLLILHDVLFDNPQMVLRTQTGKLDFIIRRKSNLFSKEKALQVILGTLKSESKKIDIKIVNTVEYLRELIQVKLGIQESVEKIDKFLKSKPEKKVEAELLKFASYRPNDDFRAVARNQNRSGNNSFSNRNSSAPQSEALQKKISTTP